MAQLELQRYAEGKELSKNDIKGLLMEQAVSDALRSLNVTHDPNPFNNTYPCYQNKRPDIVIQELGIVIECKNLSQKQVQSSLSLEWLDKNIVKRPYFAKYKRKIVLFSFRPLRPAVAYLHKNKWKVYSLGMQLNNLREQKKAIRKIKQRLFWLKQEYNKNSPLKEKCQLQLKVSNFKRINAQNQRRKNIRINSN
jgi:hypothetical protein